MRGRCCQNARAKETRLTIKKSDHFGGQREGIERNIWSRLSKNFDEDEGKSGNN